MNLKDKKQEFKNSINEMSTIESVIGGKTAADLLEALYPKRYKAEFMEFVKYYYFKQD